MNPQVNQKVKVGTFTLENALISEVANARLLGSTVVGFDENGNAVPETISQMTNNTHHFILKKFTQLWITLNRYGLFHCGAQVLYG